MSVPARVVDEPSLYEQLLALPENLTENGWLLLATLKDDDPVSVAPFDAVSFSLADLWA